MWYGTNYELGNWGRGSTDPNLLWVRTIDTSSSFPAPLTSPTCSIESGYKMLFQFEDDRSKQDAPTSRDAVAAGVRTDNFFYVGNSWVNELSFSTAEICTMSTSDCAKTCYTLDGGNFDWPGSSYPYGARGIVNSLNSDLKKQIGCFAGLCGCGNSGGNCNSCAPPRVLERGPVAFLIRPRAALPCERSCHS